MLKTMTLLYTYLLLVNIAAFVMFGIDKYRAVHDRWRIPEARLLTSAVIGGSIGALMGMMVWRHKTLHLKFVLGIPAIILIQAAAAYMLFFR